MAETLKFGGGIWATKKGSTLAYNSENGNYKPLPFTFDRAGSATRVNKQGLIEVVGNNEPRIDFLNDSKGALLLEPSRTNLWTNSNLSSSISLDGLTRTLNQGVSPSGDSDATLFNETATNGTHRFYRLDIPSTSTDFSMSFFAKKNGINIIRTVVQGGAKFADFNLSLGTVINESGINSSIIEDYGNGWYRCIINVTASGWVGLYALNDSSQNSYLGDTSKGVYLYGAQLEQGSYATSYIPTQGSIGTRVAESCNGAGNDQVINSTEGVLYFEGSAIANDGTFKRISVGTSDNLFANSIQLRYNTADNSISYQFRVGNVYQADITTTINSTNINKIACVWETNRFEIWINGIKKAEDTSGSVPPSNTFNSLFFGKTSIGLVEPFKGNVKDLRVYNTALTDQELINLTTI